MTPLQNEQFTAALRNAVREAEALGYRPTYFKRMIEADGGFETVKRIVRKQDPSGGFSELFELGRLDLSCEAIIVETHWRSHFDPDLLLIAEKRLRQVRYNFVQFQEPSNISIAQEGGQSTTTGESDDFMPPTDDHRESEMRRAYTRPGQGRFRQSLIDRYGGCCCLTGCTIVEALDAAHICAYRGDASDHVGNGLILRSDLHALFDQYLFSINPEELVVVLAESLRGDSEYGRLHKKPLFRSCAAQPSREALRVHWNEYNRLRS